jgi:hypothetical protein
VEALNQEVEWLGTKANAQRWQLAAGIRGSTSPDSPEPHGGGMVVLMDRMRRSAVLVGLLALVWVPAALAAQPTRHIIGGDGCPSGLQAIQAAGLRVIEVIPLIDAMVGERPEEAAKGLAHAPFVRYVEPDPDGAVWTRRTRRCMASTTSTPRSSGVARRTPRM